MTNSILQWVLSTDYKDKGMKNAQKDMANLKQGLASGVSAMTGFNMTGLTVIGMLTGLGAAVGASIDYYVEYTDQIREATHLTGMSAEETSRLVNITDDYGISYDRLKGVMEQANKKGFLPTIENIAALSDEYLAIEDPLARNQLLTEKLGRAGLELSEIMILGGDAIRENAAAVKDGMIVDQEALDAALAYKQGIDDLEDTFGALKITVGQEVVPALTDLLNFMLGGVEAAIEWSNRIEKFNDVWMEHEAVMRKTAGSWEEYAVEMIRAGLVAGKFNGVAATQAQLLLDGQLSAEGYALNLGELAKYLKLVDEKTLLATQEQVEFNGELYDTPAALAKAKAEFERLHPELVQNAEDAEAAAEANAYFKDQLGLLKDAISGPVGKELESYAEKMDDIETQTAETILKIEELEAIKNPTEDQQADLAEAKQSLLDLGEAASEAAREHHEAMAKIVYDMATVRAQADGVITQAEYDALSEYARRMGLVDQSTLDAQYAMQLMGEELALHPEYYENSARAMEALTRALEDGTVTADELENVMRTLAGGTWNINANVNVDDSELDDVLQRIIRGATLNVNIGGLGGGNPIPMAEGGSGVVERPTLFLAGEAGPEGYSFQPLERNGNGGGGGNGVTVNFYGNLNNGMDLEEFAQYLLKRVG